MNAMNGPTVDDAFLEEVVRRILTVGRPLKVVLFGSLARGEARPDSDLDLLIVEERSHLPPHKRATPYRMALTGIHPRRDYRRLHAGGDSGLGPGGTGLCEHRSS